MFKQLNRRLLLINMISITLLMAIAFGSIYFVTYSRTNMDIENTLNHIESYKPNGDKPPRDIDFEKIQLPLTKGVLPEREMSFVVNLDYGNNILSAYSIFEAEDIFYESAIEVISGHDNKKIVAFESKKWAFRITPRKDFYQIFFLDVTTQLTGLSRLAYTFLAAFIVMFLLTFIFSKYMTNQSIKPVRNAFEKQKQFISDASHELKTPLAIISTNVDVLLNDDSESDKWLRYIKSEVMRMTSLTENLLYLSQVDQHDHTTRLEKVDFSMLCEHALLGMEAIAYERKRKLEYQILPSVYVKGDKEQLSQVILILIDNALKYSLEDSDIHIRLYQDHHICFEISNNGKGIGKDAITKIFDRFYKEDSSRSQHEGYGLGLAIAQSIITNHGGRLICTSIPDKMTKFKLTLPK